MATGTKTPKRETHHDARLRRERWTGLIVLLAFAALMILLGWLASLGGGTNNFDYDWWMMP